MSGGYILSVVLNFILAGIIVLAYFFKDTINNYILHKAEAGEKVKNEERELLKKLRSALYDYSGSFPMYITNSVVYFKGNTEYRKAVEPHLKESTTSYNASERKLTELAPDLKGDIRDRLTGIRKEVAELLLHTSGASKYAAGMGAELSQDDFIKKLVSTQGLCRDFIADIDKKINK